MSSEPFSKRDASRDEVSEAIAVGVIPTPENTAAALRTIHRALERDHDVLVLDPGEPNLETVRYATHLDVEIVELVDIGSTDESDYDRYLGTVASARGYDGLILPPPECDRIAYDRTIEETDSETFLIQPVTERSEPLSERTVAGIPAYNEARHIEEVITETSRHVDSVIVVDDGSSDETVAAARDAGATVIEHDSNRGYGRALQTLFEEASERDVDSLVVVDADGQHDPADIPRLKAKLETGADVVIGSRFTEDGETNAPVYRRFGLGVVNVLTNLSLGITRPGDRIRDTQSGFRAYDGSALETLADDDDIGDGMNASTDILYHVHEKGYEISEVGTRVEYDVEEANTRHPVTHGLTLVSNIIQRVAHRRPITALWLPGYIGTATGITVAYLTASADVATGPASIGLTVVSILLSLTGAFACFAGITLYAFKHYLG